MKPPNACKQPPETNLAWLVGQDLPAIAGRLLFASALPALRSLPLRLRAVQGEKSIPLDALVAQPVLRSGTAPAKAG